MMKIAPIRTDLPGGVDVGRDVDLDVVRVDIGIGIGRVGLLDTPSRTVKIAASRLTQIQPSSASGTRN
jgi:hypothetical protein